MSNSAAINQESLLHNNNCDGLINNNGNKVNNLSLGAEPLQIQSLKAKLNTPVLGDKKDK